MKTPLVLFLCLATAASGAGPAVCVSASSEQGAEFSVTNLLDGRLDTRWSSQPAEEQRIEIDLGEVRDFDAFEINWEAAYASAYEVSASKDGRTWGPVYATATATGGLETIILETNVSARFIRLNALKRGTPWGYSIHEIFFANGGHPLIPDGTPVIGKVLRERVLAVDVNQAFYAPRAKKTAVVRCNEKLDGGTFTVLDATNGVVAAGELKYWGPYWKDFFWTADFSAVKTEGTYTLRAEFDADEAAESVVWVGIEPIQQAVEKTLTYFQLQRCGVAVPGWHALCHTDDGVLPDGRHIDATGGWHDCAGFDKEMYTTFLPVYFYATIASETDLPWKDKMMDEARWGADWVMKMTDTNGFTWCHVDPHNLQPEQFTNVWARGTDTDNKIGTPDDRRITTNAWGPEEGVQAMNMGALVKLGWLLREKDPAYSARCFATARRMRKYLANHEYVYADQITLGKDNSHYAIYHAGFLLADIYLSRTDTNAAWLADARRRIEFIVDPCQAKNGEYLTSSIERTPMSGRAFDAYVHLLVFEDFCAAFPDDPAVTKIKESIWLFMEGHAARLSGRTPYGQAQLLDPDQVHYITIQTHQRNFEKPSSGVSQGKNCYLLGLATACGVADRLLGTDKYMDIAVRQIDWVVGANPFGRSTVAEVGTRFPRMFTMFYWLKDHPGSEGVIPGGVINGIGGDKDDNPVLDLRSSNWLFWETNEYWNPPTAWFAMACWQYYRWAASAP